MNNVNKLSTDAKVILTLLVIIMSLITAKYDVLVISAIVLCYFMLKK